MLKFLSTVFYGLNPGRIKSHKWRQQKGHQVKIKHNFDCHNIYIIYNVKFNVNKELNLFDLPNLELKYFQELLGMLKL